MASSNDRSEKKKPTGDYEVGYCRPPRGGQFEPGKSGNPAGRPRGSRPIQSILGDLLRRRTTVRIGNTEQRMAMSEALAWAAINKGLRGDVAVLKMLFAQIDEQDRTEGIPFGDIDQEIITDLRRRLH